MHQSPDVLAISDELANLLHNLKEVIRFREAEAQINASLSVQKRINNIKKKQKELVHAKEFSKHSYIKLLELELDDMQQKFNNLPIVIEYQQSQVAVNNILQMVQDILADGLDKRIDVIIGEVPAVGCGTGGGCGCK